MTLEAIQREALQLPIEQRGALISELLKTLGEPSFCGGDEEVAERVREIESGEVENISHEELLSRLKDVPR